MNTLAERLIDAREEKGWKKSDLQRAAGIKSASTLTDLESGKATQSPQIPKIAAIFVVMLSSAAIAHSGGTNSSGCHYDHKTGMYHCH